MSEVHVAGRTLPVSPVFDTYWLFAAARHEIYERRQNGEAGPWTDDPILKRFRFTNCFRAADRVSQYLIKHVIYGGPQDPENVVFRTLLFKFFNRISTWERLERSFGTVSWQDADLRKMDAVLTDVISAGERLYSAAYVIPPPQLGEHRKHSNHLRLIEHMMTTHIVERLADAPSLEAAFRILASYPAIGNFLAYQFVIDLNYSPVLDREESEYVVPGPGALDGIRKCFGPASRGLEPEIIQYMVESQDEHFARLGLRFDGLRGRRLQLIDCQNLFCEVDKYARVAHPDIAGISGRTRIKQNYLPDRAPLTGWFPPKWGINASAQTPA